MMTACGFESCKGQENTMSRKFIAHVLNVEGVEGYYYGMYDSTYSKMVETRTAEFGVDQAPETLRMKSGRSNFEVHWKKKCLNWM